MTQIAFARHDHDRCAADALAAAEARCAERGVRLTDIRARVLSILLEEHKAIGAYQVLERLREDGRAAQPPTAYRALDFLVAHGLAHRVEKLNAFVACLHGEDDCAPVFLICRGCGAVAETEAAPALDALSGHAKTLGFQIDRAVMEVEGLCPLCQNAGD